MAATLKKEKECTCFLKTLANITHLCDLMIISFLQLLASHTMSEHGIETYCYKHIPCPDCDQIFLSPATLQAHSLMTHKKRWTGKIFSTSVPKSNFQCGLCGYLSSSMPQHKTHLRLFHPDNQLHMIKNKLSKHR